MIKAARQSCFFTRYSPDYKVKPVNIFKILHKSIITRMKSSEVLIYNGKIWRSGAKDADWFTFNTTTGRVTGIGQNRHPDIGDFKESVDVGSSRIFPGLQDSHIHVEGIGDYGIMSADLTNCSSIADFQKRIKDNADKNPQKSWINGRGWDQALLGRYPNRQDIDAVCQDRPAFMYRTCGHVIVANSLALKIGGVTKDTPNPDGGIIDRFPKGHPLEDEPTGVLREIPASSLITSHREVPKEEKKSYIKAGLDLCLKNGLTAVHCIEEKLWNEYSEMAEDNELPIRVFMAAYYEGMYSGNFPLFPKQKSGQLLSCDRVKIFVDGALGACTAALSRGYKKDPSNCGVLTHSQEKLDEMVQKVTNAGFRLEFHVIGDRAAEAALNAIERAQVSPEKRPILTHCQILRDDLVDRMVKQGVIASIQPQFVTSDALKVPELVPDELMKWSYAWKSLLQKGIVCAGGSDAPIENPEPFIGLYDAIYRPNGMRNADNQDSFRPEECLSVKEAVDLYTKAGAYTEMREDELGQLLPGYMADFVVVEGTCDPVENPKHFLKAKAAQVWVAGKRML